MDNGGFPPIENVLKTNYKKSKVDKRRFFSNAVNATDIFNIKIKTPMINNVDDSMKTIDSL